MATTNNPQLISLEAGADLSSYQFKAVKVTTTANQVTFAGAGENAVGILYEPAGAAGRAVAVANGGVVRAYAGGSITIGGKVAAGADGVIVAATTGAHVLGVATTTGASGAMFEFIWQPEGILA